DKAQVELWVKADLGQVPVSPTRRERPTFPVPDHDSTLVSVATDPEATSSNVALYYLQPVHRDSTVRLSRRVGACVVQRHAGRAARRDHAAASRTVPERAVHPGTADPLEGRVRAGRDREGWR